MMTDPTRRGRIQFLLLALLFVAPLLSASVIYFFAPDWRPQGRTNYGELLMPARPLPPLELRDINGEPLGPGALRGKWSYVYLGAADCDESCAARLYQIRQIRLLLNEKRLRVQRVYLAPDAAAAARARERLGDEHADLEYQLAPAEAREFFNLPDPQALYLLDPLGNWLMWYPAGSDSKGMLKDIKKLLRVSQIG